MTVAELAIPRLSRPLKLWERLELVVGDDDDPGQYWIRIEDFVNSGIMVSQPEFIRGGHLLSEGVEVLLVIPRTDAVYQCQCRIKSFTSQGQKRFFLTPPCKVSRLQRRRSVRVDIRSHVRYAILPAVMEWEKYGGCCRWQAGHSINVSAHGILLGIEKEITLGDVMLLEIGFFRESDLPRTVLGICRRTASERKQLAAGIEFQIDEDLNKYFEDDDVRRLPAAVHNFDQLARNRLMNWVFQKQIEFRSKGLL